MPDRVDMEDTKQARRAAREKVGAYYEQELARLLERVAGTIDRYRAGELDVHEADDLIHRYKQATRALWSFCWGRGGSYTLVVARLLDDPELGPAGDWWEQAERRRR